MMYTKYFQSKFLPSILTTCDFYRNVTKPVLLFSTTPRKGSTIYALSSGQGKCGVAVVRISGDEAKNALFEMTNLSKLEPRKAVLKKIYDPISKDIIDKGLCLWFPGPNSFTGEDSVEFHVHGGLAILTALMSALSKLNFDPAMPGEFTKRAFYNKKLDLTEVEGLADLIHAETEYQRKQALLQAHGHLSKLYENWKKTFLNCITNLEAYIDFSEEDNIENDILHNCNILLENLLNDIQKHLSDGRKGEILRSGVRTVIIGEPNVGKSSLLNHLLQRNAAIVSSIAGTTRDTIELSTNISGYPVIMIDTAGLSQYTDDEIETEGIRRAKIQAETADFIILAVDSTKYIDSKMEFKKYLDSYVNLLDMRELLKQKKHIIVMNKIDLLTNKDKELVKIKDNTAIMSCKTEEGSNDLIKLMSNHLQQLCGNPSVGNPTISQTRYRSHLIQCSHYLKSYFKIISLPNYDIAIAVEEIRLAMRELGKITGHVTPDEILENIFKNFCIGK